MEGWFDNKFERSKVRKYTRHRLKSNFFIKFYRKLSLTNWLIIFNFIIYVLLTLLIIILGPEKTLSFFALTPNSFFSGTIWTVFTSVFSHIWLPHLLFNMISLFFIGNFVEKIIGRNRFLVFYILSGIFAGLFYGVLSFLFGNGFIGGRVFGSPLIPSLGASGAIFALVGLLAVLTPRLKVYFMAGPIIALIIGSVFSAFSFAESLMQVINLFIYLYIFLSIFSIFSFNPKIRKLALPLGMPFWVLPIVAIIPLVIVGLFWVLPIGNMAHLGGLIAGLSYGFYLKSKYKRKTIAIGKHFSR